MSFATLQAKFNRDNEDGIPEQIEKILQQYPQVFATPKGLP